MMRIPPSLSLRAGYRASVNLGSARVRLTQSTCALPSRAASTSTSKPPKAPKSPRTKGPKAQLAKPRLDYAALLSDPARTARNVAERAMPLAADHVERLAAARAAHLDAERALTEARADHGRASSAFRDMHQKRDKKGAIAHARALKERVSELESVHDEAEAALLELALPLPNLSLPDVPVGPEEAAIEMERFGPEPLPADPARDHVAIADKFNWLDPAASAVATGSSWPYLLGVTAQLEHALIGYALSIAVKHGYTPVSPPDVVSADVAWRCGFQPRDGSDGPRQTYFLEREKSPQADSDQSATQAQEHGHNAEHEPGHEPALPTPSPTAATPEDRQLCLTGTAEIPLAALFANRTLYRAGLPARVVGVGRAFRAEAGARGADTRGLYRVHQFTKVELFCVSPADGSEGLMEEMRAVQREVAEGLGLSVRVLDMPTEELGASAARKYDMEAWMPGRGKWGEITSTSNCTDYQARRLHIRYREPAASEAVSDKGTGKGSSGGGTSGLTGPGAQGGLRFAHTLNGTAAAVPRLIVALIENGARIENGEVVGVDLPRKLRRFWIGPEGEEEGGDGVVRWV